MDNCWRCNRPGHHRRDCDPNWDPQGDVTLNKKTVELEHKMWKPKGGQKQKFLDKLNDSARQFLRQHLDKGIDVVSEVAQLIAQIGTPSSASYELDLKDVLEADQRFRSNLDTMRDIVAHSKNYVYHAKDGKWDSGDTMFKFNR